jgi:hypothetical protein
MADRRLRWSQLLAVAGLNSMATRLTDGAMSCTSSSHLLPMAASKLMKPVILPPGRARLCTKPGPIGSDTATKMIGTLSVVVGVPKVTISSGRRTSNSCSSERRSARSLAARMSMRTFWRSIQPSAPSLSVNARRYLAIHASSGSSPSSTPIRRMPPACCARATTGHDWRHLRTTNIARPGSRRRRAARRDP